MFFVFLVTLSVFMRLLIVKDSLAVERIYLQGNVIMSQLELSKTKLDIADCFEQAIDIYKKNFILLIVASAVVQLLIICSVLILAGPLAGGFFYMLLNAYRRDDKTVQVGDIFRMMHKFWPLFLLMLIEIILVLLGLVLLVIPVFIVNCFLLYTQLSMIDKDLGVRDSLKKSYSIVIEKGFGVHLLLSIITLALAIGPSFIPYVGWIVGIVSAPLASLMITSSYLTHMPAATIANDTSDTLDDKFPED